MKLPIWCKIGKKYYPLTHFADGEIGISMEDAVKLKLNDGVGSGMGKFDRTKFEYVYTGVTYDPGRFILRKILRKEA